MRNAFIAKLEHGAELTDADRVALDDLTRLARKVGPRQDIVRQDERPDTAHLVLEGFACRYKTLENGSRQNVSLLLPGDICDLHVAILDVMDHSIATLSPCTIAFIPSATILHLMEHHPRITRAFWWSTLVDEAIMREWLVNNGQRPADQRMAHLFCELLVRLQVVGLADASGYELPLTQYEIASTLGITLVHVNRTLQSLRAADLVEYKGRRLTIPDVERLNAYCDFDAGYLHMTERYDAMWRKSKVV